MQESPSKYMVGKQESRKLSQKPAHSVGYMEDGSREFTKKTSSFKAALSFEISKRKQKQKQEDHTNKECTNTQDEIAAFAN